MPKLTDRFVANVKADPSKRVEVPDAVLPGLYLVVQVSGAKSWAARYRHQGRPRKLTVGSYPAIGLAAARELAREALGQVAKGTDPAAVKAAEKTRTFAAVAALFVQRYCKAHQKNWWRTERLFESYVLPKWRDRDFASIKRDEVNALAWELVERGPTVSNHVLSRLKTLWAWAVEEGLAEASPCDRVKRKSATKARVRNLTDDEIRIVWQAWGQQGWPAGDFQKLLLVTGQRRSEVAGLTWGEIDLDAKLWSIPAERMKSGRPHLVPLSTLAMEIISRLPRFTAHEFLFPTWQRATRTWGPLSSHGPAKSRCDYLVAAAGHEMAPWVWHDLRRTCRSNLSRLRVPSEVAEAVIAHAVPGVRGTYDRWAFLPEKAEALESWAGLAADIVDPARKIIAFRKI